MTHICLTSASKVRQDGRFILRTLPVRFSCVHSGIPRWHCGHGQGFQNCFGDGLQRRFQTLIQYWKTHLQRETENYEDGKNKISSSSMILRGRRDKLVQHVHRGSQQSNPTGPSTLSGFCVTRHACGGQTLVHIKLIFKKERKRVAVGLERWLNS